jgi:di/tricarboxylate transporter
MAQPVPPGQPVYARYISVRYLFILFAVVCFGIAVAIGADWITEPGKVSDVLVFLALGGLFFSAAHV